MRELHEVSSPIRVSPPASLSELYLRKRIRRGSGEIGSITSGPGSGGSLAGGSGGSGSGSGGGNFGSGASLTLAVVQSTGHCVFFPVVVVGMAFRMLL